MRKRDSQHLRRLKHLKEPDQMNFYVNVQMLIEQGKIEAYVKGKERSEGHISEGQ